jgi:amino acid transporter
MSSVEQFGYREQLHRSLSTRDLIVYGMIFMVPIAPFAVFGFVWDTARGMVPLAYLVGLIGMLFTAMSYAAMSRAFPLAGSVYTYAGRGLHEVAGFFAGWLILLDYILVPALLYVFSAVALAGLMPAVPEWAWLLVFVVFNLIVNLRGIHFTAQVNWYLLLLELATLALFVILGLLALHRGLGAGALTLKPVFDPAVFSPATVVGATSIAVLSFLGFDGISTLAEESKGGLNSVARATIFSLILVGVLFIAQTWIATDLAHGMKFDSPATAFYEIAERAGGSGLRLLTILAVVVSNGIANAMVAQSAVSRILFAMARDGKLPSVLARIHPRYKSPYISALLVSGISLIVGIAFAERLDALTSIVNFGALCSFLLLHIAVVNYFMRRQASRNWLRHLLCPALGFIVIAFVLFEMDRAAKIMGACWILLGVIYYLILTLVLKRKTTLEI